MAKEPRLWIGSLKRFCREFIQKLLAPKFLLEYFPNRWCQECFQEPIQNFQTDLVLCWRRLWFQILLPFLCERFPILRLNHSESFFGILVELNDWKLMSLENYPAKISKNVCVNFMPSRIKQNLSIFFNSLFCEQWFFVSKVNRIAIDITSFHITFLLPVTFWESESVEIERK